MVRKNDSTIFWIIGIVVLLLVFTQPNILKTKSQEDFTTIKVHYYDADKNEVFPYGSISDVIKEDDPDPPFFTNLIYSIKKIISQIGTFGIVTTTKSFKIPSTASGTYCEDHRESDLFDYYGSILDAIGSDYHAGGAEECNGLIRFSGYSIPSDLTSASQITNIRLHIKTTGQIYSDEGNGASTDFATINNLDSYDWTPDSSTERELAFDRLELVSGTREDVYSFKETTDDYKWFNFNAHTWYWEDDIVARIELGYGMEGEYDTADDESVDFYTQIDGVDAPYLMVYYTVTTCVPETCASLGYECGTWDDTCEGTIDCGTCSSGYDCLDGVCILSSCTSHDSYSCYDNDIYWYDSCGNREEKLEECGTSGYVGSNYCYDNDVYRDYETIGCSDSSCTSSTSKVLQEDCGTNSCLDGVCIENIVYISFEVTATNPPTSEVDYISLSIIDATPIEFWNALPPTAYDLPIGSSQLWNSGLIEVKSEWRGTIQTFKVWISGTNTYTRETETKYGSVDVSL